MRSDNLLTAQELISESAVGRQMLPAPDHFSGTVEELVTNHVLQNLIASRAVEVFHELVTDYLERSDPLFLIRAIGETVRGQIYDTNRGSRFKATDNAPAWWIHFALFHEIDLPAASFASIIETLPTHFFEVASQIPHSISSAGWHVAHIFPVKDRNTDYWDWDRKDLVRRCVRNIHPCNYFFIPKADWQLWGGNERLISYFARLYEAHYGSVWAEFLSLARADSSALAKVSGPIAYHIGVPSLAPAATAFGQTAREPLNEGNGVDVIAYKSTRLAFKADVIEPLVPSARFRIITPVGTFEMSKAEFYSAFPRVVQSKSYNEGRLYHYPTVPGVAQRFRIDR